MCLYYRATTNCGSSCPGLHIEQQTWLMLQPQDNVYGLDPGSRVLSLGFRVNLDPPTTLYNAQNTDYSGP